MSAAWHLTAVTGVRVSDSVDAAEVTVTRSAADSVDAAEVTVTRSAGG